VHPSNFLAKLQGNPNYSDLKISHLGQPPTPLQPICFNYDVHAKFEVAQPIHCSFIAILLLIRYVTLWPWPMTMWPWPCTFDLKHL